MPDMSCTRSFEPRRSRLRCQLACITLVTLLCTASANAQPANDDCATPTVIGAVPFAATVDTSTATTAASDPIHSCTSDKNARSVWYSFTAATSGKITANTFGTNFDTQLAVYAGTCGAPVEIACNDDAAGGLQSKVSFAATAGTTYLLEVTGIDLSASGVLHLALAVAASPMNDECGTPKVIAAAPFTETRDTTEATAAGSDPVASCTSDQDSASVWYSFTPPSNGTVTIDTSGSDYDTVLAAYTGACGALTEVACNDDSGDGVQSAASFPVTAGTPYLVEAAGFGTKGGGTLAFALAFLSDSALPDAVAAKAADKCQKAITKAGSGFVAKKLATLDKCAGGLFRCVQTVEAGAKQDGCITKAGANCTKGLTQLSVEEQKFKDSIMMKCGVPALDFVAAIGGSRGLGYASLGDECQAEFDITLDGLEAVAGCIVAQHECRADNIFEAQEPRARELIELPLANVAPSALASVMCLPNHGGNGEGVTDTSTVGKPLDTCAKAVRKAGAKFARAKLASLARCAAGVFTCQQTKPNDLACVTKKATATCTSEFAKIDAAAIKLAASIEAKCADAILSYDVLRLANAANLDAFAAECERFQVTDLDSLAQYKLCLFRQHECRVEELLRFEVPRAETMIGDLDLQPPRQVVSDFCPTPTPGPTP